MGPGTPQDEGQNQPLTRRIELGRIKRWAKTATIAIGEGRRASWRKNRGQRPIGRTHLTPAAAVEIAAETAKSDPYGDCGSDQIEQISPRAISSFSLQPRQGNQAAGDGP